MSTADDKLHNQDFLRDLLARCGFSGEILEDVAEVCKLNRISVASLANDSLSVCELGTKLLLTDDEVEAVVGLAKAEVAGLRGKEAGEVEGENKENLEKKGEG